MKTFHLLALAAWGVATASYGAGGNADAARGKISMCIGCHGIPGYHTAFPEVYHVPKLGGQHPAYIMSALNAYKTGARRHPQMSAVAASLSEQDIADLAAYYGAEGAKK